MVILWLWIVKIDGIAWKTVVYDSRITWNL